MASEPLSLKPKSFTTIYDFKDKVLSDNFSSESFESWKFKAKTSNSATVDFKAKFAHDFTKDGLNVKLNDEVKIKFPFYENKFWAWFGKKNNDLKFHFDFGTKTFQEKEFNFFTNLKTPSDFKKFALRFGVNHFGSNFECNTRVDCSNWEKFWITKRNLFRKEKFLIGHVTSFGYKFICVSNLALGFEDEKFQFYLQHKHCGNCNDAEKCCSKKDFKALFKGTLSGTFVYKWKDFVFGDKLSYGFEKKKATIEAAVQQKVNDKFFYKGKVTAEGTVPKFTDSTVNLALYGNYKVNSQLVVGVTTNVPIKKATTSDSKSCCCCCLPFGFDFEVTL